MEQHEEDYYWLLDYQERSQEFRVNDWGCGMVRYRSKGWGNKGLILVKPDEKKAYLLVEPDGVIVGFTADDFDWEDIRQAGYDYYVRQMKVDYRFEAERFKDGVATVYWMIHPDGSYYADEDGFGRTDDQEVYLYAQIDTHCRIVKRFSTQEL